MERWKSRLNEQGLSLVEVLAALVILGIVFIGFLSIFPQMTLQNKKTETKLGTMNIARQEMAFIKSLPYRKPITSSQVINLVEPTAIDQSNNTDLIRIDYTKGGFHFILDFEQDETLSSESYPGNHSLHKVHLKVLDGGRVNSETFGFIEVKEVEADG